PHADHRDGEPRRGGSAKGRLQSPGSVRMCRSGSSHGKGPREEPRAHIYWECAQVSERVPGRLSAVRSVGDPLGWDGDESPAARIAPLGLVGRRYRVWAGPIDRLDELAAEGVLDPESGQRRTADRTDDRSRAEIV